MLVIYLMTLTSNLILGHISRFLLVSLRLRQRPAWFRLSTSLGLPTIHYIRTSIHRFIHIEMDHIKFHSRSMGGFFS